MTVKVGMNEASKKLSLLAEEARAGETVIITRHGEPYVELRHYVAPRSPRTPGRLAGKTHIADDFDDTSAELIDAFEGRS